LRAAAIADAAAVAAFFGDYENEHFWEARVRQLVKCAPQLESPKQRAEAVLLSLTQILLFQERAVVPRIDAFLLWRDDPPTTIQRDFSIYLNEVLRRIERALDETLSLAAQLEFPIGKYKNIARATVDDLKKMLKDAGGALNAQAIAVEKMARDPAQLRLLKGEYVKLLAQLRVVLTEMKATVDKM
jgi:hypothetical protein